MPDNVRRITAAGMDMAMVAAIAADGHTPSGLSGTIANGASSALKRMYGVKTAQPALPAPQIVNVTGDDTRLSIYSFDPESLPTFPLTAGEMDADIVAKTQGTNVYTVGTYYDLGFLGPIGRDFPDMFLWIISQAESRLTGNKGATFHNQIIPRCDMTFLGRNFDERGAALWTWNVAVKTFDTFPWGGLIGNNAAGKNEAVMFDFVTTKRPQVLVIKDDGVTNSYTLPSVPWVDGNSNVRFIAWRNGVVVGQTGSTSAVAVNVNKTITLGAGLTGRVAGDVIFIFAEVA